MRKRELRGQSGSIPTAATATAMVTTPSAPKEKISSCPAAESSSPKLGARAESSAALVKSYHARVKSYHVFVERYNVPTRNSQRHPLIPPTPSRLSMTIPARTPEKAEERIEAE